jgi:hypothetical protein
MAYIKGYGWLLTGLFAIATTACFETEKDDEDEEEEETTGFGSDGADGGSDGADGGSDGADGGSDGADGGGDSAWDGERYIDVYDAEGSTYYCSTYWLQAGDVASSNCDDCIAAFDVTNNIDLNDCGFGEDPFTTTLGVGGTYYFEGYGDYDVVQIESEGSWYVYGFVSYIGGGTVEYYTQFPINDGAYLGINYGAADYEY